MKFVNEVEEDNNINESRDWTKSRKIIHSPFGEAVASACFQLYKRLTELTVSSDDPTSTHPGGKWTTKLSGKPWTKVGNEERRRAASSPCAINR